MISVASSFWKKKISLLKWKIRPKKILSKKKGRYVWFEDGKLNIFYNLITKNIDNNNQKKLALILVNKIGKIKEYTYQDLFNHSLKYEYFFLKLFGKKNISKKKVMIQSSTDFETILILLSCIKLGIEYSVIFNDIEKEGIYKRVKLFKPNIFLSQNKKFNNKKFFLSNKIYYYSYFQINNYMKKSKINFNSKYELKFFSSNKNFFTLFTSGSTGTPKGILHNSAGFLLYVKYTAMKKFGLSEKSVMLTASDIGWLNGHNYSLFAPFSVGATTVILENPLLLLDKKALKKILNLKISILYLPVTLIRMMKSLYGEKEFFKTKYLKTLGSMGEHLAPSTAKWFSKTFTRANKCIVNAYYQTENGGIICSPSYKDKTSRHPHGSVGNTINNSIRLNDLNKKEKRVLKILTPWPGCMKKVLTNNNNDLKKYWDKKGQFIMHDLATKKNNSIYIHGRSDDVINIRGKRIGCEEIESTLQEITSINETCAVSIEDELEGNILYIFVISKVKLPSRIIIKKLKSNFGVFSIPRKIFYVKKLPKTKSGKILRRLLRDILINPNINSYGDISTIQDIDIIKEIKKTINEK